MRVLACAKAPKLNVERANTDAAWSGLWGSTLIWSGFSSPATSLTAFAQVQTKISHVTFGTCQGAWITATWKHN